MINNLPIQSVWYKIENAELFYFLKRSTFFFCLWILYYIDDWSQDENNMLCELFYVMSKLSECNASSYGYPFDKILDGWVSMDA